LKELKISTDLKSGLLSLKKYGVVLLGFCGISLDSFLEHICKEEGTECLPLYVSSEIYKFDKSCRIIDSSTVWRRMILERLSSGKVKS